MVVYPTTECIMPVGADEASRRYQRGLESIGGADPYRNASRASTPQEAAEILENAKEGRLDVSTMVSNYRDAYA